MAVPSTPMGHSEKPSGYGYMYVQALNVCIEQFSLISHMTRRLSFTFMVHRSLKVEEPRSSVPDPPPVHAAGASKALHAGGQMLWRTTRAAAAVSWCHTAPLVVTTAWISADS